MLKTNALQVYLDKRLWLVLCLGFSSGLPLALTGGTLSVWLTEAGTSKTAIGIFALVGLPYTLKFLWSPLIDRMPIPLLTRLLGRRRSWMLITQLALMAALVGLGLTNPFVDAGTTALLALIVAFCSASQDIVIDAYRVDILDEKSYGAGAAMVTYGYRIGMLASGAGALYLASFFPWSTVYFIMAGLVLIGFLTALFCSEPERTDTDHDTNWFHSAVISPFADFMKDRPWLLVLAFIVLYKLGDAFVSTMSNPFFLDIGFSKIEIANITKVFGVFASLFGAFVGGLVVSRMGILKALLFCGIFQALSNLIFAALAYTGHDLSMLTAAIAVENVTGGMGTAALVAYLSSLCNASYSATQYALLSSLMAVGRTVLSSGAGALAENTNWPVFFVGSTLLAIPALLLLIPLRRA